MAELKASRTLVKSRPELWAECSDAASLARHLGAFGEIQITKLEPETAVAWEGEAVRGTVTLGPSGWGTRVVLTAEVPTPAVGVGKPAGDLATAPEAGPVSAAEPDPGATVEAQSVTVVQSARPGFFRRLFGGWRRSADPLPVPDPVAESADVPPVRTRVRPPIARVAPDATDPSAPAEPAGPAQPDSPSAQALVGALDSLGRAHRRPFSHG